jgi:hypothetical protein
MDASIMFKAYFFGILKRGGRGVVRAGIISFAASFGTLNVFAAGWAAAVVPTGSELVVNTFLAAVVAQFAMSVTHALLRQKNLFARLCIVQGWPFGCRSPCAGTIRYCVRGDR